MSRESVGSVLQTLSNVLELLYLASSLPATTQAVVRIWSELDTYAESSRRWANIYQIGSTPIVDRLSGGPPSGFRERTYHIWREDEGKRLRLEYESHGSRHVIMVDGREHWFYEPQSGFRRRQSDVDRRVALLFDPTVFLHLLWLELQDEQRFLDRPAIFLRARPRVAESYLRFNFPFADDYELVIDAEFGVVLRFTATLDSKQFIEDQVQSIAFNEVFSDELFRARTDP